MIKEAGSIIPQKFGTFIISSYICTVRAKVLTTPLNAGSKALSILLHFKKSPSGGFLFFI